MATVQVVYNLCTMPEYIPTLRLEAQTVLQSGGAVWTVENLNKLHRLDSFLKESQRMNASSFRRFLEAVSLRIADVIANVVLVGFDRKVMSTIKLSDGTVILPGDTIAIPSGPMAQDQIYYDDPIKFDGYRFLNATTKGHDATQSMENEYTGIEPGNLTWGNGRFSCPGGWYASLMMKLILARFMLEYDFEFPESQTVRPSDFVMDVHVLPDMKQRILIKKR